MELEVGEGLTGEEVVVEAAHRRRHHRHPLEETLPLHRRTHLVQGDHQNASHSWSSKRSSRSKYKFSPPWTGALGNPVAMSYIGNNNRTLDNSFSFLLTHKLTECTQYILIKRFGSRGRGRWRWTCYLLLRWCLLVVVLELLLLMLLTNLQDKQDHG